MPALLAVICLAFALPAPALADEAEAATLPAAAPSVAAPADLPDATPDPAPETAPLTAPRLPSVLGPEDSQLYADIFQLQEKGLWDSADRRIKKLGDKLLMGHVLAQRYLHPTKYRSRFSELAAWLKLYADHPDAKRIHDLAMRRKPGDAAAPPGPRARFQVPAATLEGAAAAEEEPVFRASADERAVQRHVARYVAREYLTQAERYLESPGVLKRIGRAGVDRGRALVASGWFRRGDDQRALDLAGKAARRSGVAAPDALWWAGLAAFRLERFEDAFHHLETLSLAPGRGGRGEAAASFWAARAALRGGRMEKVGPLLDRAARHDRSFYGQIAARIRGAGPQFDWRAPQVNEEELDAFAALKAGKRTLALVQIGEAERAETELRALRANVSPALLKTVIALADAADMPGTALRAGRFLLAGAGTRVDAALYPILHWMPEGGYQMDRALVYALARQESGFNVRARSHAGARGLLQLMPATARFMAQGDESFHGRHHTQIYDPRLNLALGQKYLDHLRADAAVAGNLVMMIAAYNAGPGNLIKWQRRLSHENDPLIFIESIPVSETRAFVQRVLENLWIYRARLGQEAPSLDALAGGLWPEYVALDAGGIGVAEERP